MSMFKAGRAVGKGVKYLTQLGSKIGKSLKSGASGVGRNIGRGVDRIGAATRNTQAAAVKGARGVRDAANSAGSAVREGAAAARRGYNTGRNYDLHLNDVMPKKSSGTSKLPSLGEWMNTKGKGYIRNPGTMPGSKTTKDGKAVWANGDKMPKPSSNVKKLPSLNEWMATTGKGMIRNPMTMPGNKMSKNPNRFKKNPVADYVRSQMAGPSGPKNRRAGIITGASIAAGYGVHRGNDALQNHYRQQKNAARGQ